MNTGIREYASGNLFFDIHDIVHNLYAIAFAIRCGYAAVFNSRFFTRYPRTMSVFLK